MFPWIMAAGLGLLVYFGISMATGGFSHNVAFRGLTGRAYRKICRDHGVPESVGGISMPLAMMIAHASYPKASTGDAEWDVRIGRLPTPIVGPDQASTIAHRYVDFNEMNVDACLRLQYGKTTTELLDLFLS